MQNRRTTSNSDIMTTLYIDNRPADFDLSSSIAISLSTASVTSLEKGKTGYSRSIVIPATPLNRELMGDCEQLHSRNRFNAARHMARVECDGFTIIDGVMMLSECPLPWRLMKSTASFVSFTMRTARV